MHLKFHGAQSHHERIPCTKKNISIQHYQSSQKSKLLKSTVAATLSSYLQVRNIPKGKVGQPLETDPDFWG